MAKQEFDLLEEYIAFGSKEAREDVQLAEFCDLVDEIRALHPPMPAADFVQKTVDRIAANVPARPAKGRFYRLWFKTAGWTSAAVAAVLLVTMGVLPHKPSEQLPTVPTLPIQQIAPAPVETPQVRPDTDTAMIKQTAVEVPPADKAAGPQAPQTTGKTEVPQPETAKPAIQPAPPVVADSAGVQKSIAQGEIYQDKSLAAAPEFRSYSKSSKSAGDRFSVLQEPRQAARVPGGAGPVVADIQSRVPFKMLTLPEHTPVQAEVHDSPPGVTMTYVFGPHEIVVREWLKEQDLSLPAPADGQRVVLQRGDVVVEVAGNTDATMLEEVARNLQ